MRSAREGISLRTQKLEIAKTHRLEVSLRVVIKDDHIISSIGNRDRFHVLLIHSDGNVASGELDGTFTYHEPLHVDFLTIPGGFPLPGENLNPT